MRNASKLSKRALSFLERAFIAEVESSIAGSIDLLQTKSRWAEVLEEDGYLIRAQVLLPGNPPVTINGYRLTHLGRLTYCATCED